MDPIRVKKVRANAMLPTYGSQQAAGADLYACLDEDVTIAPGQTFMIPTGLSMELPVGYAGFIYARSSLGTKRGLAPANKVGVVDSDYRGEVMVALHNHSSIVQEIEPNERIAQLVVAKYERVEWDEVATLDETERGEGGFGSTGL